METEDHRDRAVVREYAMTVLAELHLHFGRLGRLTQASQSLQELFTLAYCADGSIPPQPQCAEQDRATR